MRDELAERVLARVMDWDETEVADRVQAIQALASHKYDEYGQFRPGVQFAESLAGWLSQFSPEERAVAVDFVQRQLVFISEAEIGHLIQVAYPDFIRPLLARRVAADLEVAPHLVRSITQSSDFAELQRRTLILGMSDGARLDRLRRASKLSHEQFHLTAAIAGVIDGMRTKLGEALEKMQCSAPNTFRHVVLVDDFSGTGFTLIRRDSGGVDGKLPRLAHDLTNLREAGAVPADVEVSVLIYVASEQAQQHVVQCLAEVGLDWRFDVIQRIDNRYRVDGTDPEMGELCATYYDPVLTDEHKGEAILGFRNAALPLVLSHNAPNDSVCLLWGDTTDRTDSRQVRALFPRYERHHPDRP